MELYDLTTKCEQLIYVGSESVRSLRRIDGLNVTTVTDGRRWMGTVEAQEDVTRRHGWAFKHARFTYLQAHRRTALTRQHPNADLTGDWLIVGLNLTAGNTVLARRKHGTMVALVRVQHVVADEHGIQTATFMPLDDFPDPGHDVTERVLDLLGSGVKPHTILNLGVTVIRNSHQGSWFATPEVVQALDAL